MRILCHVGPWCREQFHTIATAFDPAAEIRFVSGFRALDETGLVEDYYRNVRSGRPVARALTSADREIILRCRLLRSFDESTAARHLAAMQDALSAMLDREKPDVLFCESIDQFLHDLLFREAERRGIAAYGLIRSFVNNYFRISTRGEYQKVRDPDDAEVETVRAQLVDRQFIPGNLIPLKKNPALTYLRIQVSNQLRVLYFALKRHLSGEPYNYHYWTSTRTTREMYAHFIPQRPLGRADWKEALAAQDKPVVYVPLQHVPEATVDYWSEDLAFVDYWSRLPELLTRLSGKFHFLIKEHPGVWGYRKPSFYRRIAQIPEVTMCPTECTSQECIPEVDAVLVWTGSVGFEAALRGKPVLMTCHPYYAFGPWFKHIALATPPEEIEAFVGDRARQAITVDQQRAIVRHLLAGMFPGRFQNDGTFSLANPRDVSDAQQLGRLVRVAHEANGRLETAPR